MSPTSISMSACIIGILKQKDMSVSPKIFELILRNSFVFSYNMPVFGVLSPYLYLFTYNFISSNF